MPKRIQTGSRNIIANFDPNQPRDEDGQWSGSGGGGGGGTTEGAGDVHGGSSSERVAKRVKEYYASIDTSSAEAAKRSIDDAAQESELTRREQVQFREKLWEMVKDELDERVGPDITRPTRQSRLPRGARRPGGMW